MKICTEKLYSLFLFPCTVKYKSKLNPLLADFLFLSMHVACGACDIYHFLLFAPVIFIPFSPTSVLSLQPLLVCFMDRNRLLDTVIFDCCF